MSEPNDAQAVIAGVLRESLKPLVDPFNTGADSGWVETWCTTAAEAVDTALGQLRPEFDIRATQFVNGLPVDMKRYVRWVGRRTAEEAQP